MGLQRIISATEKEVGISVEIADHKSLRIHFATLSDEELSNGYLGARATIKVYGRIGGKEGQRNNLRDFIFKHII